MGLVVDFRAFVGRVDPEDAVHPEGTQRTRRVVVVQNVREPFGNRVVVPDLLHLVGGSVCLEDGRVTGSHALDPGAIGLAEGDDHPPAVEERQQLVTPVGVGGRVGEGEGDADGGGAHAYIVPQRESECNPQQRNI